MDGVLAVIEDKTRNMMFYKNMVVLLLVLLLSASAVAQESPLRDRHGRTMINGVWQSPTPATALRDLLVYTAALEAADGGDLPKDFPGSGTGAAEAVLRQMFDVRSAAELDAFAAELVRVIREGTRLQAHIAYTALRRSGSQYGDGTRYAGAADILIGLYEESVELRAQGKEESLPLGPVSPGMYLRGVFSVGGADYVRNLFKTSQKPPACTPRHVWYGWYVGDDRPDPDDRPDDLCPNVSTWCDAGKILIEEGEGPHPDEWSKHCDPSITYKDGFMIKTHY